jgi:hypothetical protein
MIVSTRILPINVDLTELSAKERRFLTSRAEVQQTKVLTRPKAPAMLAKINKYVRDMDTRSKNCTVRQAKRLRVRH